MIAAFGQYKVASENIEVVRQPAKAAIEVNLRAAVGRAKSDGPPEATPAIGMLPEGSFRPAEPAADVMRARGDLGLSRLQQQPMRPGEQEFVNVFYITNRAPGAQPGYYIDRPLAQTMVNYGVCTVSFPPIHKRGSVERPTIWRIEFAEEPQKHIIITQRELIPDETVFQNRLHRAL